MVLGSRESHKCVLRMIQTIRQYNYNIEVDKLRKACRKDIRRGVREREREEEGVSRRMNHIISGTPSTKYYPIAAAESKMEYKVISPEHYDNVIKHLRNSFFSDEPLNKAVKLCRPGEGHEELEKHCLETLKDDISLMAVDATGGGQIAGVILNGILRPGETEEALKSLLKSDDEKFVKIFELIYREIIKADLFKCFQVDRIFDVRILSVDGRYRGQGFAKELVRRAELLAQTCRFRLLKADATGIFSQKILRSNGFQIASEQLYAKYKDKHDQLILPVEAPHLKLQLLIKQLNNCDNDDDDE